MGEIVAVLATAGDGEDAGGREPELPHVRGHDLVPRRWVVERTFSWPGRNRSLAKDFENLADTLPAFVTLGAIGLGTSRLARGQAFEPGSVPGASRGAGCRQGGPARPFGRLSRQAP